MIRHLAVAMRENHDDARPGTSASCPAVQCHDDEVELSNESSDESFDYVLPRFVARHGALPLMHRGAMWRAALALLFLQSAGATEPLAPQSAAAPVSSPVPVSQAGIEDGRGRFREIFCAVLAARSTAGAREMSCDRALERLADEPRGSGRPVDPAALRPDRTVLFVPGLFSDCIAQDSRFAQTMQVRVTEMGYRARTVPVSGLSSSSRNAGLIRDALAKLPESEPSRRAIIVGHSKGVVDTLVALVAYPETRAKVAAVISLAGAVGGSPLAELGSTGLLGAVSEAPGLGCRSGDLGGLESLSPVRRRAWLAEHALPEGVRYFSVVALPQPDRISLGLKIPHALLSRTDARNDGQLIYSDQVVPHSTLLGYANADHWAMATDLTRSKSAIVRTVADRNDYPRAALLESALRYAEERMNMPATR